MKIVMQGEIIPKKNNLSIRSYGSGKKGIGPNEAYRNCENGILWTLKKYGPYEGKYPAKLIMFVYRRTRRTFDFDNQLGSVQDILQKSGIIEGDSMKHIIPVIRDLGWAVDKLNPRIEIELVPYEDRNML